MLIDFDSLYYEYSRGEKQQTRGTKKIGLGCEMREKKFLQKLIERLLISRLDTNDGFLKFFFVFLYC